MLHCMSELDEWLIPTPDGECGYKLSKDAPKEIVEEARLLNEDYRELGHEGVLVVIEEAPDEQVPIIVKSLTFRQAAARPGAPQT